MKILVTGAGAPGGPGIIKALKSSEKLTILSGDIDPHAAGRFLTDEFFLLKKASDSEYIGHLFDIVSSNNIDLVVPLVTAELEILSRNLDKFDNINCKIIVSDEKSLEIANSKGKIYSHMASIGLITPDFRVCTNFASFEAALYNLGYPDRPVVMKPSNSNGSRGIRIIDDSIDSASLLFDEKPGSLKTNYGILKPVLEQASLPELVLSEYLPGDEITVDTVVESGRVLLELHRTRRNIRSGISVAGKFVNEPDISKQVEKIISSLPNLRGPIGLQFKRAVDGTFKLLEINPRLQGTTVAALGININIPKLCVDLFTTGKLEINYQPLEKSFTRYYQEVFYDNV